MQGGWEANVGGERPSGLKRQTIDLLLEPGGPGITLEMEYKVDSPSPTSIHSIPPHPNYP